jgi:hypothetical protein
MIFCIVFKLTFFIIPTKLLSRRLFNNILKDYALHLLHLTFDLQMTAEEIKDLQESLIVWLLKNETPGVLFYKFLRYLIS